MVRTTRDLLEVLLLAGSTLFVAWRPVVLPAVDHARGAPLAHQLSVLGVPLLGVLAVSLVLFVATRTIRHPLARVASTVPPLVIVVVAATSVRDVPTVDSAHHVIAIVVACLLVVLHLLLILEATMLGEELIKARDDSARALAMKSDFVATVSHEIRTPMNAVIGLTGLLLDSYLDAEQRELATGVAISAEGLLALIDDVLDFSKADAAKVVLDEVDLDLGDLLGEVAMIVSESAHRKGVDVFAYSEPGLETCRRGDPLRLRQILLNLASNAIAFTDHGSVVIRAVPAGNRTDRVSFEIIDTGVGIDPADHGRLFEPFTQLEDSMTRTHGGTGLGLTIVKRLVELQGGTISLESALGSGTTFTIDLPLPVAGPPSAERSLASLSGLRALVVDTNAVSRTVLAYTLHTWGFIVDQASTPEEALHLYGWSSGPDEVYALALLEHHMEGMDGLELADVLRSQEPTSSTVILLLSSDPSVSRQAAHDAGIESVLIRPVRNAYLLRRIMDSLATPTSATDLVGAGPTMGARWE